MLGGHLLILVDTSAQSANLPVFKENLRRYVRTITRMSTVAIHSEIVVVSLQLFERFDTKVSTERRILHIMAVHINCKKL